MDDTPPAIRKGRKYDQVVQGAREIFLRDGYERASVDEIALQAGVSKATLYAYFPDKRQLFGEVVRSEFAHHADEVEVMIVDLARVEDVLRVAAHRIIGFMSSDFGRQTYRMIVAEAENFPQLAEEFYSSGPMMARDRIVTFLRAAVLQGQLTIVDFELAADQFSALCKGGLQERLMLCPKGGPSKDEVSHVIEGAVAMFMARYAARP